MEPDMTNVWVTCETEGCGNQYIPIFLEEVYGAVICGPCGNPVTNVTDIEPEEGTVLPQWILDQLATTNSTN